MENRIYEMFSQGRAAGAERKKQRTLASLMPQAVQGDKDAISGLFGAGATNEAMTAMQFGQQRQESSRKQLADLSNLMISAPQMAAQVYPQWKAAIESSGLGVGLPDQFEEGALEAAKAFATAGGAEQFTLAPGSARYDANGRLIVSQPFAPPKPDFHLYDGADGPVWLPKPGQEQAAPSMPSGGASSLLEAVMMQESGGNPNAVSPKGARGLMQIMPGTGRDPGFGVAPMRDDSPQENVRVGRDYLNAMIERYQGNEQLALAAYNAGPGRVDQALQRAGGDPQRAIAMLPAETRNYVPSVQARAGRSGGGGVSAIPVSGVRPKPKQGDTFAPLSQDEVQQMGLPAGTVAQRNVATGEVKIINKPDSSEGAKGAAAVAEKQSAWAAFDTALTDLESAMDETVTGPIAGRIPALTADQQTAEGAVAILAPMLKQIFRTAGEGTFTDKDQELLMKMVPTRADHPEARARKIASIRKIVRQKLLGGQQEQRQDKPASNDIDALLEMYR